MPEIELSSASFPRIARTTGTHPRTWVYPNSRDPAAAARLTKKILARTPVSVCRGSSSTAGSIYKIFQPNRVKRGRCLVYNDTCWNQRGVVKEQPSVSLVRRSSRQNSGVSNRVVAYSTENGLESRIRSHLQRAHQAGGACCGCW